MDTYKILSFSIMNLSHIKPLSINTYTDGLFINEVAIQQQDITLPLRERERNVRVGHGYKSMPQLDRASYSLQETSQEQEATASRKKK